MKITYYGHASLGIQIQDIHLLVDPYITANPKAEHIDIKTIKADYILITHAHQDHILNVEAIAKRTNATIVSNFEISTFYQNKGFKVHPMAQGGERYFDFGLLKYVNAIHSSSFPDGTYGGQPGGFVLQANDKTIYIAGDTALTYDMKLIAERFSLDLVILPIGDNFTMGVSDAIVASEFVNCTNVLGYHYDTFGYIEINHKKAISAFKDKSLTLHLLPIGDVLGI